MKNLFVKGLFLIVVFQILSWKQISPIRRIVIDEYPGATILPQSVKEQFITASLFDGRFLKIHLLNYQGKMYLQCFGRDSVLREEGNYINSLALLKKYSYNYLSGSTKSIVAVVEYFQPLRNGMWKFYDSTGNLIDSATYERGIKL